MKICIITAVWKRPEVFKIFAESIKLLKGDIVVCVVGSEGDKSRKMVESYGFQYTEAPNKPLGVKWNQAAILASQTDADYYLLMGSDDIINQSFLDWYIKLAQKGYEYIYVTDGYFYDTVSAKSLYWSGYKKSVYRSELRRALGCGKMLSKRLMIKASWRPWETHVDRGLDNSFNNKMRLSTKYSIGVRCEGSDRCILDIKSSTNMTPFAKWENCKWVDSKEMLNKFFPELDIWKEKA